MIYDDYVFPAHAGMNRSPNSSYLNMLSVPRARGDEPGKYRLAFRVTGCSPRTRG